MIKKIFEDILNFTNQLDKETFKKYLIILTIILFIFIGGSLYLINEKSDSLINKINSTQKACLDTNYILKKFQEIESQKKSLQKNLESNAEMDIKGFFETFTRAHRIKSDSPWTSNSNILSENPELEEITLQALFKGQTMEALVKILKDLEDNEKIFVKNLKITKEAANTISFEITIGTLKSHQK